MARNDGKRLCGFDKKPCIQARCEHWIGPVRGTNKNTGEEVESYDCVFRLEWAVQLEVAQLLREAVASLQSLRNETVKRTDGTNHILHSLLLAAKTRDAERIGRHDPFVALPPDG